MKSRLIALGALALRDMRLTGRYQLALALELVFGLLNLAVFFFFAEFVSFGGNAKHFFEFAAIGIAIAVVVEASVAGIAVRLRQEQLTGTLEELLTQPVRNIDIAFGIGALPLAIASVRMVVYLGLTWLVLDLDLSHANWAGAVVMLVVIAVALLAIGALVAAAGLVVKRSEVVVGVAAFSLAILGGAYFPISTFPPAIAAVAGALPTRFAFDGARDALLTGSGWQGDALWLALFAVVALPLSLWAFGAAVSHARRNATLSEY